MSPSDAPPEPRDPRAAAALAAVQNFRRSELAQSPLAAMADWVASGAPPPAAVLRAQGLEERPDLTGEALFRLQMSRRAFVAQWGFSIPCAEAVAALRGLGPLVELGCGAGYWSALLTAAGLDIVATDAGPEGAARYGFDIGGCCEVERLTGTQAVRRYPERDVFCSWPTEGGSWALGAAWALAPGRVFALIGDEAPDSRIGTRGLYRYLATRFDRLAEVTLPQFPGNRDRLTLHRKR